VYRAAKNPRRPVVYQRSANRNLLVDHAHVGDLVAGRVISVTHFAGRGRWGEMERIRAASHVRAHYVGDRFDFREASMRQEKGKQKETPYRGHACKRLNGNDRGAERDRTAIMRLRPSLVRCICMISV
jgi:hypothetical protein